MVQLLWRAVWRFLKKLKIELPYKPALSLIWTYPEQSVVEKDTCTAMGTAALFIIASIWKPPKCPLTDEWIKRICYAYTMEYNSAIKKTEIMPFVATCRDLEITILSEVSQTEKDTHTHTHTHTHIYVSIKCEIYIYRN